MDFRVPLPGHLEASGSVYRGAGLGGLGAGAFKDYVDRQDNGMNEIRALDDIGDNAFAGEIRDYVTSGSAAYQNLARNSTFSANGIYSPTAYTIFSFEYRRLDSSPVTGPHSVSGVYGAAATYRF